MTASYRAINYTLRPSKCVERKMLAEAFRRLASFSPLESYWYIGFGSTYFSDFYLFHKTLNISKMDSIEKDTGNKQRFEFNRPYQCIKLHFGSSTDVLPSLSLDKYRTIIWLDYDGTLVDDVLTDLQTVFGSVISGSIVLISLNADPTEPAVDRLNNLKERLGSYKVPHSLKKTDFSKWGTAKIYRSIIQNEIEEILVNRNGGSSSQEEILYQQLFNFHYDDRAKMLTVGGILYSRDEQIKYQSANFNQLEFIKLSQDPYFIRVPNLTYRELRYLDRCLPIVGTSSTKLPGVPSSDIQDYSKIYRYFPMFAEAEL